MSPELEENILGFLAYHHDKRRKKVELKHDEFIKWLDTTIMEYYHRYDRHKKFKFTDKEFEIYICKVKDRLLNKYLNFRPFNKSRGSTFKPKFTAYMSTLIRCYLYEEALFLSKAEETERGNCENCIVMKLRQEQEVK